MSLSHQNLKEIADLIAKLLRVIKRGISLEKGKSCPNFQKKRIDSENYRQADLVSILEGEKDKSPHD